MEYKGIEVKTMEGLHTFAESAERGNLDDYLKPGDIVDDSIFDDQLNSVPPHRWSKGYLQAGEAYDCSFNPERGRTELTYTTFQQIDKGVYMYLGNCFTGGHWDAEAYKFETVGEFLKKTYRVNPAVGLQETRPRIYCKDGFNISVQAGDALYSRPRQNLQSGGYKAVECGFPSGVEELLMKYAEEAKKPKQTVYAYVPIEIIEEVVKRHGGPLTHA